MAGEYPKLSLCMIARNEEKVIADCIKSVQSIVDEIILVDTGSTDDTVKIAEQLGAQVFHEEWKDDFASARNISLEKATGEWILVLDADEVIAESDLEELQKLTLDRTTCTEFLQRHYTDDHRLSGFTPVKKEFPELEGENAGYFESNCCRLFPHGEGLHFQGRIHELVEHSIRELGKHKVERTEIRIHHYGHTTEIKKTKNKAKLYTPLGEKKISDDPSDWKAFYEMGVEYNVNGELEKAAEAFAKAAELNPKYEQTFVNFGYVLCELGRYEDAIKALQHALKIDPRSAKSYCNLGVVFMRTKKYTLAEKAFSNAIAITPDYINAYTNLGEVLYLGGRPADAAAVFMRTLEIMPKCQKAAINLSSLYVVSKDADTAEKFAKLAIEIDKEVSLPYYMLSDVESLRGNTSEALKLLDEGLSFETSDEQRKEVEKKVMKLQSQLSS